MKEVWKYIDGFNKRYMVSSMGNVLSLIGGVKPRKQQVGKFGYVRVALFKDGKQKKYLVHRLVADAFVPNPDGKPDVNHIDGNKQNNCAVNLEFCTRSENIKHSFVVIGRPNHHPNKGKFGKNHPSSKIVLQIKDGVIVAEFYGLNEASRQTGINNISIGDVCRGKSHTAGGYKWKYKE